jgi:hypothetical protein
VKPANLNETTNASQQIDRQIAGLPDWRGELLARLRQLVMDAVPDISEEWKWGTAVWSRNGLVCSAGVFKDHVKLNFFQGAALEDPKGLFNSGLDARATRAIDFKQGEKLNVPALKGLLRAAAAHNAPAMKKK